MNKALLDTDILAEIIKGFDQTVARTATAYHQAFGRYTLSAITVMEIVRGFYLIGNPTPLWACCRVPASSAARFPGISPSPSCRCHCSGQ